MKWPTHTDYQDSIQSPEVCFQEAELKAGTIVTDALGLPRVMSGNFASVYELRTAGGRWAVRCFVRQVMGQQGRYARLSAYLSGVQLEAIVAFEYLLKGILVHGEWYPILKMQWVQGQQLNTYVEDRLQDPEALRQLAARWRGLMRQLREHRLAHGDLQHGNVMVTAEGELRLVDYDGMYCPAFGRGRSPELGHANFQHPLRTADYYEEKLDNFAALGVYASLLALAAEPELWSKFNVGDNLLFAAADFRNTHKSPAFQRLAASPDSTASQLTTLLRQCCMLPVGCTPWFAEALEAVEQGKLTELLEASKSLAEGTAFLTPPTQGESEPQPPGADTPAPATGRATRAAPQPTRAVSRPAPPSPEPPVSVAAPAPIPAAPPSGGGWGKWLPLAAAAVVLLAAVIFYVATQRNRGAAAPAAPRETAVAATPAPTATPAPAPKPPSGGAVARPAPSTLASKAAELRTLSPQNGAVTWLGFTPNGRAVATGGQDGTLKLWEPATGQVKQTLEGQGDGVHDACFPADGKTLLTVSLDDNHVRTWTLATGKMTPLAVDLARTPWPAALAPDGQMLAAGASDRHLVRLLDPTTGAAKRMLPAHSSWVRAANFSGDGKLLAVSCWDDTVKVWDTATAESPVTLTVLSNTVEGVVFSPDNRLLAAGGQARTVKLWDTQTGALKQTLLGHNGEPKCYAFSPSGRFLATGAGDKVVRVYETATGLIKQTFSGHTDGVTSLAFSPDGALLASGGADQLVKLWDVSEIKP